MAERLKPLRGDKSAADLYTGEPGEISTEQTENTFRLHDGIQAGGHIFEPAKSTLELIEDFNTQLGGDTWQQGSRNTAPVFDNVSEQAIQGETSYFTLAGVDPEGDSLSYSVTDGVGDVDFSLSGNIITFNSSSIGEQVLTVTVTDIYGLTGTGTITVNVVIPPPNVIPVLADIEVTVLTNEVKTIPLGPLTDSEGDSLTYTLTGGTGYVQTDNKILFDHNVVGDQIISAIGDDGRENGQVPFTVTIHVVAETSEVAPVILDIPETFPTLGSLLTVTPVLSNPNTAGTVRWYKDFGHDDIDIHPVTGVITWDTTGLTGESYHLGIRCENSDGIGRKVLIIHLGKVQSDIWYIGPNETYQNWEQVEPLHKAGDTIIYEDGQYLDSSNMMGITRDGNTNQYPKSGNIAKATCILARNPLKAIFMGGDSGVKFNLWAQGKNEASYINFKGLLFKDSSTLALNGDPNDKLNTRPSYLKVINCGGIGEDDIPLYARLCDYILFEGCFALGGGRYKISVNECTFVVYRRNVSRYDRSDRKPAEDPKGSFIMYNTMDFRLDNCISVDDVDRFVNNGYKVGAFGTPVTATGVTAEGARGTVERCLHLNSEQLLSQYDYQVSNGGGASDVENRDISSYDSRPHDIFIYTWGFNLWEKCTFQKIRPIHVGNSQFMINGGNYNNCRGFLNCILDDFSNANTGYLYGITNISVGDVGVPYGGGVSRIVERYGMVDNNITNGAGVTLIRPDYGEQHESGTTAIDISTADKYVTRFEPEHELASTHAAELMTLKGKSGTFYGQAGYDQETNIPMWSFPFESYIREVMKGYSWTGPTYTGSNYLNRFAGISETLLGDRGFCVDGETLTSYVWGYKGNTVPPMGVLGFNGDAQCTLRWNPLRGDHATNLTGYTIYDYDPLTHAKTNPRAVAASSNEETITGLINGFNHWFVITATDSIKGESGFSYPIYIRPNGTPTVLPSIDTHPISQSVVSGDVVELSATVQGYNTLQWKRNGVDIPGATGLSYTFTAELADDGASYTIVATNDVGPSSSTGATMTVKPLDSTPPTITVALSGSTLTMTVSDNIYLDSELSLQLVDDVTPIGAAFSGSVTSIDLSVQGLATGTRNLTVTATDPQNNVGTSNTVQYLVGVPVFTDDFSNTSNWSGSLAVAGNVGTINGRITGTTNWWVNQTKSSTKFDLKILDQANDFEAYPRFEYGCGTDGSENGTIKIFAYPRQGSNCWMDYIDRAGANHSLGSFSGFGNVSGDTGGNEPWIEYELTIVGTTVTLLANEVVLHTATLPEDINPFNGTMRIEPNAAGDLEIRNLVAYGD